VFSPIDTLDVTLPTIPAEVKVFHFGTDTKHHESGASGYAIRLWL